MTDPLHRRAARAGIAAAAVIAAVTLVSGCGGSGFLGLGPKDEPAKGRMASADGDAAPVGDPALDAAYDTYRRAYLFWNAEEKSFLEGMEGNAVQAAGSYLRMKNHLAVMDRYLAGEAREKFHAYLLRYESAYQSVAQGQVGRGVVNEVRSLGNHIRSQYNPAKVALVAPVAEGPALVAAADVPPAAAGPGPAAPGAAAAGDGAKPEAGGDPGAAGTAGHKTVQPPKPPKPPEPAPEPRRIAVTPAYREAFSGWQVAHRTLVAALYGEKPDLPELYKPAQARLEAMKAELPAPEAAKLQTLEDEYERALKLSAEGATARRLINQFGLVAGEIEKAFDPAALNPEPPK